MRLLIVGPDKVFSIENFYVKYLREYGISVNHFPAQSFFTDYYAAGLYHKILFKAGLSGIYGQINNNLKKEVEEYQPDIVWIFKGMELFPRTLEWIKSKNILLVNYNPDNPFLFSGRGSGNKNITNSLGLYDLHFTYNLEVKREIEEKYNLPVKWLPFGFDIPEGLYKECQAETEEVSVCFVGNPDKQRAQLIQYLVNKGIRIALFGNHWQRFIKHRNATIYNPVYEPGLYRILRKYRIQLNPLRPHNARSHGMRTFEVPGIGGIMLAQDTPEHRQFFAEGHEAFFYEDFEDCLSKINDILQLPADQAYQIRENARRRSCNSGYDYKSRSLFVKETLEDLLK